MRAQIIVFGPIERELYVRLDEDLLPAGIKRAEELSFRTGGCGVHVAERLSQLGLSSAILTGIGSSEKDRELLGSLRRRNIQIRRVDSGTQAAPLSVLVRTPRHEVRMVAPAPVWSPSRDAVARALRASRHFHVCGSALVDRRALESARSGLRHARSTGVSTSLDLSGAVAFGDLRSLLRNAHVLFVESNALRTLTDERRLGAAAAAILKLGVQCIAVHLGAGGCRVYTHDEVTRIPSLGEELSEAPGAFPSGVVLGWLLGASPAVCGLLGNAASLQDRSHKPPTRRELSARLARKRTDPRFRKLVSAMEQAERLLQKPRRLPRRELSSPNPSI